jgi:uncharacterized membrane protein
MEGAGATSPTLPSIEVAMSSRGFVGGLALGAGLVYFLDLEDESRPRRLPASLTRFGSRLGDIAGLEAATLHRGQRVAWPASSLGLALAGGALVLYGLGRRGLAGSALRTIGAGMLASGLRQGAPEVPYPAGERRRTVDIQKTIHIEAPPEQVFAFWSNYENFPLFMSNVREVRDLGGGRSHWLVSGPARVPIEWNAMRTEMAVNERIAWRSEPGSMLENAGVIRFLPDGAGTRVDLRFCYATPAGGAGRAVAQLIGADPRAKRTEDLGRLKALLEATVRSDSHGEKSEP